MPIERGPVTKAPPLSRSQVRQSIAARAQALANHYSPPPTTGGGLPRAFDPVPNDPIASAPVPGGLAKPAHTMFPGGPAYPGETSLWRKIGSTFHHVEDIVGTRLMRDGLATSALIHGRVTGVPETINHVSVKNGQVVLNGTPQQKTAAAGLLALNGTGNYLQKAASDIFGIPVGMAGIALHPISGGSQFLHGMADYYSKNPIDNLRADPFGFGLNYVLPALSAGGSVLGRASAVGEMLGSFGDTAPSIADVARLRGRGALQQALETGQVPTPTPFGKAALVARAALRTPRSPERVFQIGDHQIVLPGSHNHVVNLFHRAVTDRVIAHALDSGFDLFGARGKIGRAIRSNLRVEGAIRNGELTRLQKATKGLSAAQEHAAWILAKGHTADSYARFHQAGLDAAQAAGDAEAAAAHEQGLGLTKVSGQYLEPGAEDPKVLRAADVMRQMIFSRERWYGHTEPQINHAVGSHWYGIHTRAEGLPDLHAELDRIHEEHGPYAESPRQHLDQHISNLERYAAQSKGEHAAALHAEIEHLKTLENDIQFAHHRIATVDQRIADLGPTKYAGRMTEHPDRLGATHRELLVERSRLEDHLNTLIAHERARAIHTDFTEKGAELRGHVMNNPVRTQLMELARERGVDPVDAIRTLDQRALRWARETGKTTRDFYEQHLGSVRSGGEAPDSALFEIDPLHRFDTEREQTARRHYEKAGSPQYGNETIRDQHGHVILGPITPADWVARVMHAVPSAELRDSLARWYESFEPVFRQYFGKDAEPIMRGFAVSQANRSPAGGITATLRVFDKLRRGQEVTDREISTVATSIAEAIRGQNLLEKGLGQKLSDFTDSLRGTETRTITGHSAEHGKPTAIDVHAARDLGYVDPKLVNRLEQRYGLMHGQDFKVDNPPGSPSGIAYERMLKQYQEITDHLNAIHFDGRSDWTPAQTQALGWSAIQRFHGVEPEDLQFAVDRNTYEVPYEVGNGMEGSKELPSQYSAALKVTRADEPIVRSIIEKHGAYVRGFHYGPGGYERNINAAGVVRVVASPEQADRIAQELANEFKQWEVWATRPGVGGSGQGFRSALEIESPRFSSKGQVEKFWKAFQDALPANLKDKAVGFTPYVRDGVHGIRVITGHPAAFKDGVGAFADRYHPVVEAAEKASGVDVEWAHNNVEVRRHSGEVPGEQGSGGAEAAGPAEAGVGDSHVSEAPGEALHQEVGGQVRGAFNPADRSISIGEHGDLGTFAHESLHAIRPSLDVAQMSSLERHYGVVDGQWTRAHEEQFVHDMQAAAEGKPVAPVVQSVFNASLVAPPEAFYLPFEWETKASRAIGDATSRSRGPFGYGPATKEATHAFTGEILDRGGFRTKASHLAASSYSKAAHWKGMSDIHSMLWSLSKETPEAAGRGRMPGKAGDPLPIRDIRQIPDSLREEAYGVYPGDLLHGEATDEVAKKLMDAWTAPPKHGEHVRWINRDFVRPLEPQTAGAALRFINGINSGFRFGRYLNPAYLRWLPQNLVLNLTQQGPLIFRNAHAMFTDLQNLDPVVYHQIAEAVSFGSARALESSRASAVQHSVANAWAHLNDHVPRMLSWIHEAQRAGYHTAADWEALMTDPRLHAEAKAIIMRANKEPIDYGAMTPRERVYMKSLFAYWPWIRAASLWGLRFPFEHPYQMAAYGELGREGSQRVDEYWAKHGGIAPPYLEGYIPAAGGPIDTSAINPWSQLAEDAQAISGLSSSHPENAGAAFGLLSPVGKPLAELITGHDQYGNIPKRGVFSDALNRMLTTFEPFSVAQTARQTQTGATPRGPLAAIEKWVGDPQIQGYDYKKGAANALKDVTNEARARFKLEHDPNAADVPTAEKQLVLRVAQIKDQTKSKSTQQIRALELADAAFHNESLADLNALMVQNKLKPFSSGDLNAERARLRGITP